MARTSQTRNNRTRSEERRKAEQRKKQRKRAALVGLGAAAIILLILLMMSRDNGTERTYLINDVSMSGQLEEFIEPAAAAAWSDAADHERPLQPGVVGGDTTDTELFDPITIEAPCSSDTDGCQADLDEAADSWASEFSSTVEPGSTRGSDLVNPIVELDGAGGALFYVTDGCVATINPRQDLCANLPANEEDARQVGRQLAADYGIDGALENLGQVTLIGVGSTVNGGLTGHDATMLRLTLTSLFEATGVQPDDIDVNAGLPTP